MIRISMPKQAEKGTQSPESFSVEEPVVDVPSVDETEVDVDLKIAPERMAYSAQSKARFENLARAGCSRGTAQKMNENRKEKEK